MGGAGAMPIPNTRTSPNFPFGREKRVFVRGERAPFGKDMMYINGLC
jgi:hypothetical protein